MSNVAVAERPATVTIAPGVTVNSNMTPEERSAVIRQSMGLAPVQRETLPVNGGFHTPATVSRMQQGERELARAPREDGTAPAGIVLADKPAQDALGRWFTGLPTNEQGTVKARYIAASRALQAGGWLEQTATGELIAHEASEPRPGQHAGQIAPTPEELERGNSGNNNLAEFEREMREKGAMLPAPIEDGRFQRDERTGHVVDTHALERCHELFRAIKDPKERDEARQEYHETLEQIYAGKLGLNDMEPAPSGHPGKTAAEMARHQQVVAGIEADDSLREQPRDAQGRYYTPSPHTPEQWEQGHASVTDANGFMPLERINKDGLSGYTLPRLVSDQTYHKGIFADLAWARANGISQRQVDAYIADGMRRQGLIR